MRWRRGGCGCRVECAPGLEEGGDVGGGGTEEVGRWDGGAEVLSGLSRGDVEEPGGCS